MKISEAISRLSWRLTPDNKGVYKNFIPNQTDSLALNEIINLLNKTASTTIQDNLLFAKLYAFLLSELLRHYTDIDFANQQINKILSEPIELQIEILQLRLKNMELQNYFKRKNILDPFLKTKTVQDLEEIYERYIDKIPELKSIEFAKCGKNWNKESVTYQLETQINLSIQNFKNNV